jgi:protein-tyrosine-phosphatase
MKKVPFVCVHNSGRSQMAEAIFNAEAEKSGLPTTKKLVARTGFEPATSALRGRCPNR